MMFKRIALTICGIGLACLAACDGKISETGLDSCQSPQQFFEEQVWYPVMADTCASCHYSDGIAAATRMKLRTPPEGQTELSQEDLAFNLELVRQVAKVDYKGTPLLLAKPQGALNHGGGVVLERGSAGLRALTMLTEMLANPTICSETKNCNDVAVLPARLWRLTPIEYEASIAAALGETVDVVGKLTSDEKVAGFSNNADVLKVSDVSTEQYMSIGETVGARIKARITELAPTSGCEERECARRFVRSFGAKMFRRPMSDEEVIAGMNLFDTGKDIGGYAEGISLAGQGLAQAPQTLYRSEIGGGSGDTSLTSYEIATSLAYMLTGAPPDATLLEVAANGTEIAKADIRRAQAERLIDSPAGRARMVRFVMEWFGLTNYGRLEKSATAYPQFTPSMRASLEAETKAFIEHVIFDNEGTFTAFMSAPYSYVNDDVASIYGISAPGGAELVKTNLPSEQRAGILTQGSVQSWYAHDNQSGPVFRGKFVRQNILCQPLPPPPPVNVIVVPPPNPALTTRERFAAHTEAPSCNACHALINPIGFGFEMYDGIGRVRDTENGKPVDSSGTLDGADGVSRDFVGGAELARLLAESDDAKNCFVTQFTRFSQGHVETVNDICGINTQTQSFKAQGTNIREMVLSMVTADNFIRRRAARGQ